MDLQEFVCKYKEQEHCDKLKAAEGFSCVNENLCTDKSLENFVKKLAKSNLVKKTPPITNELV